MKNVKRRKYTGFEEESHIGHNVESIRVYLGVKQDVFARELGLTQTQNSHIEQQMVIVEQSVSKIYEIFGVSVDVITKFNVEKEIYNICSNNYNGATINEGAHTDQPNPFDKIFELYERLLKSEREKIGNVIEK